MNGADLITDQTYNRWHKAYGGAYGGMKPDQAERSGELEVENARLKRAVAVLTVDKLILKEVVEENGRGSARKYPSGR